MIRGDKIKLKETPNPSAFVVRVDKYMITAKLKETGETIAVMPSEVWKHTPYEKQ